MAKLSSRLDRQKFLWSLGGISACLLAYRAFSDTLTMTAYYPAPNAVYSQIYSANSTYLNYCPPSNPSCSPNPVLIGIQPAQPVNYGLYPAALWVQKNGTNTTGLYVNGLATIAGTARVTGEVLSSGGLQPGRSAAQCTASNNAMIAITTCGGQANAACYCNGTQSQWQPL